MQHMHVIISYMFDCWTDTVVHLLLLKSSMTEQLGLLNGNVGAAYY